ncbi:phage tail sheath family protein [Nitratifractor salsuginis]|uniref:Major tail sheath protein n=1 Tax=Nitratifractor salsuginis (strain DSM 16511 / JCM 12458 / E9I37-1) TaxID=749222 RepID=E6X1M8_NITSE|nr:phage tail sheath family protein [Nitratifractor salsuginis]ADV47019.1 major tail sheath protein [Nitratifractor salsuginis DSM 16511]
MDLNFGINGGISVEAARPVVVDSKTPIGVVIPMGSAADLTYYNGPKEWKDYLISQGKTSDDLVYQTAAALELQNVNAKIIVAYVAEDSDAATQKQNILDGLDLLKSSPYDDRVLDRPDLIIVPQYSYDTDVAAKMDSVAAKLRATGIVDVNAKDEAEATGFSQNFGTRHLTFYRGPYKVEGKLYPASALMSGLIAYWDAGGDNGFDEFGYARSHSNRIVKGVSGSEVPIEYFDGQDCEARRLRQKGIGAIVQDVGWRSYGFETTDIDPIWQSLERVRTFYRWLDAVMKANKWARDRSADQLIWVKKTCSEFFKKLTGANIALGYEIYLDPSRCDVTAGKFTFVLKTANMPAIRELNFELVFTDQYNDALINWINAA